jgi:putative membrane protein
MAWIRTSLSLISFGFGIDSIVSVIGSFQATKDIDPVRFSRMFGLAFIALGIYAMIGAAIEHQKELRHIQRHADYFYTPRRSLGWTVALALIAIGSLAFVGVLLQAFTTTSV